MIVKAEVCYAQGSAHPTPNPSSNEESQKATTESSRQIRPVETLGESIDDTEVNKAVGDDKVEVHDSKEDNSQHDGNQDNEGNQDDD